MRLAPAEARFLVSWLVVRALASDRGLSEAAQRIAERASLANHLRARELEEVSLLGWRHPGMMGAILEALPRPAERADALVAAVDLVSDEIGMDELDALHELADALAAPPIYA